MKKTDYISFVLPLAFCLQACSGSGNQYPPPKKTKLYQKQTYEKSLQRKELRNDHFGYADSLEP